MQTTPIRSTHTENLPSLSWELKSAALLTIGSERKRHTRFWLIPVLSLWVIALQSGCAETGVTNDCLIQAVRAKSELPQDVWSRVLLVRYGAGHSGHAYTVYELPGHRIFAYDTVFGSRRVSPRSLYSSDVMAAVDGHAVTAAYLEDTYAGQPLKHGK